MTMNITVGTVIKVIQVSDTRVTKLFRNGKTEITDDVIKPVLLLHPNVRCLITYSGLAIMAEKTTSELMSELLVNSKATSGLHPYLDSFKEEFQKIFNEEVHRHQINRTLWRTSITFAGYEYANYAASHEHPGILFYGRITNHQMANGLCLEMPNDNFELSGRVINTPDHRAKTRSAYIDIGGINPVHARRILDTKILNFQRSTVFHRTSSKFIASELASIIRSFSRTKESENLVSEICIGGMLTNDGEIGVYSFDDRGGWIPISPIVVADKKIIRNVYQNKDGIIKMV